ncbi:DinB family protein [Aquimarina sp. TRL1]|uniref:DinB family protein n=1 Tax=Aquimarina sp. (strain TRL1) TaxID=2736252 RepID=UPI00158E06FD|nr:DinB family protein [Aquimarina sp. TRL1]
MTIKTTSLLEDLTQRTKQHLIKLEQLQHLSIVALQQRPAPQAWNILECIEHLNLYGDFYIPEMKNSIHHSPYSYNPIFKSGLLGNYFANMMLPGKTMKSMRTFADKNPYNASLDISVLKKFNHQLHDILSILENCATKNLSKTKTSISISKWIKLRLGDTLRVVIYHNERHLEQALRCIKKPGDIQVPKTK